MKLIALDSSGLVASVAVVEDDILIAEYTIQYKKTHSQTLLPMLEEVRNMIELDLQEVDAVAVAAGPGSFTGLRIGSATAKGLSFAMEKPVVAVPTVDGLAYNLYGTDKVVCPIMDARRSQVYTGIYEFLREGEKYCLNIIKRQCAVAFDEIAQALNELGREVIFLGDGVPVFRERMKEIMQVPYTLAPAHMNRQRAASIGALGSVYYAQGRFVSGEAFVPEYLRLSQAERESVKEITKLEKTSQSDFTLCKQSFFTRQNVRAAILQEAVKGRERRFGIGNEGDTYQADGEKGRRCGQQTGRGDFFHALVAGSFSRNDNEKRCRLLCGGISRRDCRRLRRTDGCGRGKYYERSRESVCPESGHRNETAQIYDRGGRAERAECFYAGSAGKQCRRNSCV